MRPLHYTVYAAVSLLLGICTKNADTDQSTLTLDRLSLSLIMVYEKRVGVLFSFQLCVQIFSRVDSALWVRRRPAWVTWIKPCVNEWLTMRLANIRLTIASTTVLGPHIQSLAPDIKNLICIHLPQREGWQQSPSSSMPVKWQMSPLKWHMGRNMITLQG